MKEALEKIREAFRQACRDRQADVSWWRDLDRKAAVAAMAAMMLTTAAHAGSGYEGPYGRLDFGGAHAHGYVGLQPDDSPAHEALEHMDVAVKFAQSQVDQERFEVVAQKPKLES